MLDCSRDVAPASAPVTDWPKTKWRRRGVSRIWGNVGVFQLADGREFEVDDADIELVARSSWSGGGKDKKYPVAKINGKKTRLHRFLLGVTDPRIFVDHIDGNPMNNRRSNLRLATVRQNAVNHRHKPGASQLTGVRKRGDVWAAFCHLNNKQFHAGTYSTAKDAATARDAVMRAVHGKFATTNANLGRLN